MHSKIVPAELLPLVEKYTLPFNQSAKSLLYNSGVARLSAALSIPQICLQKF